MSAIRYEKDAENIVTLTIDMPGRSANIMNDEYRAGMEEVVSRLEAEIDDVAGVIVASAKDTFFAGADLSELIAVTPDRADEFFDMLEMVKGHFRRLETLGVPVAAAINGTALGGGWEIPLGCHYRVCIDDPKTRLGLPEVKLGVLPGAGGITRTVRMIGLEKALPLMLEGKELKPAAALKAGIIDELASDREDMMAKARAWVQAHPKARQPWDERGFKIPGGSPSNPRVAQMLAIAPAMLSQKTRGCYPAPEAILAAAVEGAQVDVDTALRIESRALTRMVCGQVSKNMIGTFWFQLSDIRAGRSRPDDIPEARFAKVGVLGAGMMGSGIAWASASRGFDVVLKDVSVEAAEQGKAYSEKLLARQVSRGRKTREQRDQILGRIQPSDQASDLNGCDLIIEAVFENRELKAKVTSEAEAEMISSGVFASNTSTLPITGLAGASARPAQFIGLHFFSPVDKMQLVEIIKGAETSAETLARAFDFVQQIGKIPIVVNDSRGFFTSRVFGTFVNEGVAMLAEGVAAPLIEQAALQGGMPVGPLTLADEVSLTLITHIRNQTREDLEAEGRAFVPHPADRVFDEMVDSYQREGKAKGAGFYDYPAKGKKALWPGLKEHFGTPETEIPFQDAQDRMLFIQSIETVRCVEEGVLESTADANIGSIFGIGFPPWTGGALQFINQYGLERFIARAKELESAYGERFVAPQLLIDKCAAGESF